MEVLKKVETEELEDIYEILPELDIFLMTSKTEGLGSSILDAYACKVPVVATIAGGIPEIVLHEKTGLLTEIQKLNIGYILSHTYKPNVYTDYFENKEVNIQSRYASLEKHNITGDFRFVVMQRFLSVENELSLRDGNMLKLYFFLKKYSLPDEKEFGLDYSNVTIEKSPLILRLPQEFKLKREF